MQQIIPKNCKTPGSPAKQYSKVLLKINTKYNPKAKKENPIVTIITHFQKIHT